MSKKPSKLKILTNGILNENPVLRLVLGTCPTLATSTMASNGIGMGLAATFVLLCSNAVSYTHLDVYKRQEYVTGSEKNTKSSKNSK